MIDDNGMINDFPWAAMG